MTGPERAAGPECTGPDGTSTASAQNATPPDRVAVGAFKATAGNPPVGCHDLGLDFVLRRHDGDILGAIGELALRALTAEVRP